MERRVSVNDPVPGEQLDEQFLETGGDQPTWEDEAAVDMDRAEIMDRAGIHGPCLYFGRSGERCANPAIAGGYCAKHHPDADKRWPARSYSRVLVATSALVVILWPYLADALRLLIHFVHAFRGD